MTNQAPTPHSGDPSRLADLVSRAKLAWRLFQDPSVSVTAKLIPVLAILYVLSPIDLIPDSIPIITQIDDVAILLIALKLFTDMATPKAAGDGPEAPDDQDDVICADSRVRDP
jgi:uncharacterized membrane protein YkvA (DUF1232 family)